ncbi:MAG: DUF5777 family beta-barrel protein [Bacteroidales bacterium]|nr:DUF5777 family beta-barrel protein [Bacteroidales bacterium]
MKKILLSLSGLLIAFVSFSQDAKSFERPAFETSILIDNQTVATPFKGSLEFEIHHRFGKMNNGITDLYGVYAPSNIRLGFNYGFTDKLMLGFGTTKDYKLQDFQWKYLLLQQTTGGEMPVTVSYYGNAVLDARSDDSFGPADQYKFIHRFSYFSQIIVARRFSYKYSLQVAPSMFYYNAVEVGRENLNFGIHAGGKANVIGSASVIAEYDYLFTEQPGFETKPNLALGVEIGTGTHVFQIFASNYSNIINQRNLLYNTNDFASGEFLLGFNITVRF